MKPVKKLLCSLVVALAAAYTLFIGSAVASPSPVPQYGDVSVLRTHVLTIDDLERREVLPSELANQQRQFYADQASYIREEAISVDNLRNWNRFKAIFRVQVILKVLAVIISIAGALFFFGGVLRKIFSILSGIFLAMLLKLKAFLMKIPVLGYEIAFCGTGACLMLLLRGLIPNFFGAVIFFLSLTFLHGRENWNSKPAFRSNLNFISATCWITYAGAAWWSQSITLGFLASLAFVAFFGFKLLAGPLVIIIGFDSLDRAGQGTFAAGCLLGFGFMLTQNYLPSSIDVFQTGALFVGSFVYLLGLIILSSKWVRAKSYWIRNAVTFISGPVLIGIATSLELGSVNAIAGTFFVVFVAEKYVELCTLWVKDSISFGAALLGAGLVGFGLIQVIEQYSQYVIAYL